MQAFCGGLPGGTSGKEPACQCRRQETQVQFLGWKDALEEGMTTHSSILAWRIPVDRGAWWATVHGVAESQTQLQFRLAQFSSVAQSCPTLWLLGLYPAKLLFSVGILQARILEWVVMPPSRGSSPPRDQTQVSPIIGRFFTVWTTREVVTFLVLK